MVMALARPEPKGSHDRFSIGFLTGKELDPDFVDFNSVNRRYHFPFRSYLPFRGVFVQLDPLVLRRTIRRRGYAYGSSNPALRIDPTGLQDSKKGAFIGAGGGITAWYFVGGVKVDCVVTVNTALQLCLDCSGFIGVGPGLGIAGGTSLGGGATDIEPDDGKLFFGGIKPTSVAVAGGIATPIGGRDIEIDIDDPSIQWGKKYPWVKSEFGTAAWLGAGVKSGFRFCISLSRLAEISVELARGFAAGVALGAEGTALGLGIAATAPIAGAIATAEYVGDVISGPHRCPNEGEDCCYEYDCVVGPGSGKLRKQLIRFTMPCSHPKSSIGADLSSAYYTNHYCSNPKFLFKGRC